MPKSKKLFFIFPDFRTFRYFIVLFKTLNAEHFQREKQINIFTYELQGRSELRIRKKCHEKKTMPVTTTKKEVKIK